MLIHIPTFSHWLAMSFSIVLFMTGGAEGRQPLAQQADDKVSRKAIRLQFCVAGNNQDMLEEKAALLVRVETANTIYQKTQLRFEIGEIVHIPEAIQELVSRDDRNSLVEHVAPPDKMIQVFLVRSARDVDKLDGWIAGVHWRYSGKRKVHANRRLIILSEMHSNNETLAHELGHWFGLNHVKDENNLMCGTGARSHTALSEEQVKILHINRDAALKRKEIDPR